MSLQKLAIELDETARQSASLLDGITEALELLSASPLRHEPTIRQAMQMVVTALQGQDRIEQRCNNMATAVRQIDRLLPADSDAVYNDVWAGLTLDELRVPALSGIAARQSHGEVELF